MTIALEARTHDPFWMLARQWQLGELTGSDAGSPIVAAIESVDMPLDREQTAPRSWSPPRRRSRLGWSARA
jgi:hypothetical protein